ncbi:MAG TPA: DNA methyltransferase [Phycisphaerae bacterium]|nr:DNA methyltransferase [Phycisphaerae bacterium]
MKSRPVKPPLRLQTTTLWEYPSQDYGNLPHGDKDYIGATPAWVIWNLLQRYTRESDVILDPMAGSGTTLDVAKELNRTSRCFDIAPRRADIAAADARNLPLPAGSVDFVFIDPPYSTHVDYSDDPRCIGKLDAGEAQSPGKPNAYYRAMDEVFRESWRVMKNRRYIAVYVSDSFKKGRPFVPIGFELFSILKRLFDPIDVIAVVRHNRKLKRGNWHTAAVEGNFFLRGFNYLMIFKKVEK